MIRSKVDLPQPDAPIRHTNSPLSIVRLICRNASTSSVPIWKTLFSSRIARNGRRGVLLSMMLRAPAKDTVADRDDDAVGREACDADHDHAGDDEVGPRKGAPVHDDRAEARRHAGHLADDDEYPREAVREPQPVENARR